MSFINELQNNLTNDTQFNSSVTENGALGYGTTGKALLDLNFKVASLRGTTEECIINLFMKAFYEHKLFAVKWLFYARDVREGLGERRLFRVISKHLCTHNPEVLRELIQYIPEYGRWDDMWELLDTPYATDVLDIISSQLHKDKAGMKYNADLQPDASISLLAKWLPSVNASSTRTRMRAHQIRKYLGFNERSYRKLLSTMRSYLRVVEKYMSHNQWGDIDYEAVPSRANLIYNNAFLRHDEERRRAFLGALERGEAKINSSVLYPHDIVHNYVQGGWSLSLKPYDAALEGMWKGLPDIVNGSGNTIVVADGSGSMTTGVGGTKVSALSVANALAIYFAERSNGQFKDKYITFSHKPQLVDFSQCTSLREKIEVALRYDEVSNTNIEAVFDLILKTAISKNMEQSELPHNILIVSDMEFDGCASTNNGKLGKRLFAAIAFKFQEHGYVLPRLIFWNVNSRTGTIPVIENDLGVALVSGYSVNIIKMVLSGELDPYKCLIEQLISERYAPIMLTPGA